MNTKKRIFKAGYLLATMPIVFWKATICILLFIAFVAVLAFKSKGDLHITDVSAAFTTGNVRPTTDYVVIHHTAGRQDGNINQVAQVHFGEHRWSTIGYHYFVAADGSVFQLKPDDEVAPHSYHYNNNAVAICCSGNFNDYPMPEAQYSALLQLTRLILQKYNLKVDNVLRHCDLDGNQTECPGRHFDFQTFREDL